MKLITYCLLLLSFITLLSCVSPEKIENKSEVIKTMSDLIEKKYKKIEHIEVSKLPSLLGANTQFIYLDARTPKEQAVSKIYGAISEQDFTANKEKYKNHTIIAYCTIGERSSKVAKKLKSEGYKVYNLKGGVLAWAHAGKTFFKENNETKKVHVYSEAWNFLPKGYEGTFK